jgi:hypothetical protein
VVQALAPRRAGAISRPLLVLIYQAANLLTYLMQIIKEEKDRYTYPVEWFSCSCSRYYG